MLSVMQEKRPLKRPKLGPPDVYPQEAKQKEDELTSTNVKHGFATTPQLSEEFGTARNCNVTASKVGAYFNAILAKKEELMTLSDSGRKKQQINPKDNFWPVTARTKATLDTWFKDLAGTKPLLSLAKKAPSFNKKEEIFSMLCENQVSMQRAAWFIKLSSAYTVAVSEAKIKKRQMPDPATEWTGTLIKFMKDLIPKLQEHYHQGPPSEKSSPATNFSSIQPSVNISSNNTVTPPLTSPAANMPSPATIGVNQTPTQTTNTGNSLNSSTLNNQSSPHTQDDHKLSVKQWTYTTQLSKYMYEEGLLDRQEFLNWVLDLLDKLRSQPSDDGILKIFLPITLQYMSDFVQSERLSRRLAYLVAKKLMHMLNNAIDLGGSIITQNNNNNNENITPKSEPIDPTETQNIKNEKITNNSESKKVNLTTPNPYENALFEYLNCPHHRDLVLQLSAILQIITVECPTALVWCGIGENRSSSMLFGSPLDHLPTPPSTLPMPTRCMESNQEIRKQLKQIENVIKLRSQHADAKWCTDKWQSFNNGNTSSRILSTLDALDSHCFDRMDSSNSLETLYAKIFASSNSNKEVVVNSSSNGSGNGVPSVENRETKQEYNPQQDAPIVQILCEWSVSALRWGEHRTMAVAWLLDKRQSEVTSSDNDNYQNNDKDDKDSVSSGNGIGSGLPIFQNVLMTFLDNDAPVLDENGSQQNRVQFTNLVHLFSELIRHDVFSHDAYMCTLISRGDLLTGTGNTMTQNLANSLAGGMLGNGSVANSKPITPPVNPTLDDDMFIDFKPKMEEFDDSNVDDDLDKLLQHIKEDQQNSMDAPDSPKDTENHQHSHHHGNMMEPPPVSRHFLYTKHFPLCQDDPISMHDCNQRYILLFGVGKERDEKKHAVKKMSKEICKLFSKKFSIDVAEGGKVKKHSRNEFNFESTTNKCQSMSYFDQHFVTWQCAVTVQEMLNSFALGNSNYLPVQEHVSFLFDLMEMALNIYGLIDLCIQILKELPEVESQLMAKNSTLIRNYTTSLSLYVVGVLRRYHSCLLLSADQTSAVFEGLCKVVKHVTNPGDCSSAERCILAYLYDLYSSCSLLKSKPQPNEPFHNAYPKIKQALYSQVKPVTSTHPYNPQFMAEIFANPKRGGKIEPTMGRQLSESPANRYNFVCNAVVAVSREGDNDRLNDISATCAELTACCNSLNAEWLGVLSALCRTGGEISYPDAVSQVDIQNLNIHNSLAVFTCILVARHCISLENFVVHVALPSLVDACKSGREMSPDIEAGARLSCHLLLRFFKTIEIPQPGLYSVSTSPNPITTPGPTCNIKLSCDRHLLAAAHKNIAVAPVLAVLKGILVVGDATAHKSSLSGGKRSGLNTPVHPASTPKSMGGIDISHILGTSDLGILGSGDDPMLDLCQPQLNQNENESSLSDFAQHVLRQICSQEWVLERSLQHAEQLFQSGMLIDPMLTAKQAQRLLHMICYPEIESNLKADMEQKSIISRILENLEQWSLRISWLDLQLMFKQTNPPDLTNWLDMVARAAIDVFQLSEGNNKHEKPKPSIWLVSPLVSKLPSAVQGRILRVAGQVLEQTKFFNPKSKENSGNGNNGNNSNPNVNVCNGKKKNGNQLNHQPFLGLVLTCLKGQDEQKEGLLTSLHSQLSQFLSSNKELEKVGGIDDPLGREEILDALQLRFSLVGGLFDAIQKNATSTTDWAILLTQLISQGVIDLNNNSELFTTVLDMIATLIHSTLISDSQSERDENKKLYTNLMKKLRKELGDKNNSSIKYLRQLLPLSKQICEVITCEPTGSNASKGNKIAGFDSTDKKHSLRLVDKQRVSVWDLLEGHKNPAPLSWSWFGAVKMERKPLAYEEAHRLLKYHTHSLVKPSSYYYEPLPLPPEDLEPIPKKQKEDFKADTPSSVDQSPSAVMGGRGRGKGVRRTRKPKNSANNNNNNGNMPIQPNNQQQMQQNQQQLQQQQQQQQMQQQMQPMQQQQQQSQMVNNQMGQMQMSMQNQMNPNMQQYQQNQMNQNQNQMMGQQMGGQGQMGGMNQMGQNQQVGGMNFGGGMQMGGQVVGGQQQNQQQWGYSQMQQQQMTNQQLANQQQQFYNSQQGMQPMTRYERPQQINNSKQALSNMLRQRVPIIPGNQGKPGVFNVQQQQRQQQQQQQYMRNPLRTGMGGVPGQMGAGQNNMVGGMGGMGGMGQGGQGMAGQQSMNSNAMLSQQQQVGQIGQNMLVQNQQNQQTMMVQNNGMLANAGTGMMGQGRPGGMVQSQSMGQGGGMMSQGAGMVGQGMGSGGNVGMQGIQSNAQQNMYANQQQQQYQGMNQNFGNYGNQGMNQQNPQQNLMNNFDQMSAQRNTQAEFLAAQQQRAMQVNRNQYMQQAPNVTMNNMGGQGAAPPYPRGPQPGGKPVSAVAQSQQQFQLNQQRIRQQMLLQQQQQQQNNQGMGQNQGQGLGQQQTPALVAQLQRQMPNQQNMMGQQYSHQPPPY